jgi:hypothetical protein
MPKAAIVNDTFVYVTGQSLDDRPESAPEDSIFQDDSTGEQYWVKGGVWVLANHKGASTDTKPKDAVENAWYYEEDTRKDYQFIKGEWVFVSTRPTPEEAEAMRAEMEAARADRAKQP